MILYRLLGTILLMGEATELVPQLTNRDETVRFFLDREIGLAEAHFALVATGFLGDPLDDMGFLIVEMDTDVATESYARFKLGERNDKSKTDEEIIAGLLEARSFVRDGLSDDLDPVNRTYLARREKSLTGSLGRLGFVERALYESQFGKLSLTARLGLENRVDGMLRRMQPPIDEDPTIDHNVGGRIHAPQGERLIKTGLLAFWTRHDPKAS